MSVNRYVEIPKEVDVSIFDESYEIVPGTLYGWNFKCTDSKRITKFSRDYDSLIDYTKSYCQTHRSNLIIYDFLH
jgi:hypothetical protein